MENVMKVQYGKLQCLLQILNFKECRDVINKIPEELLNILSIIPEKYENLK